MENRSLTLDIVVAPKGGIGKTTLANTLFRVRTEQCKYKNAHNSALPPKVITNKLPIIGLDLNTTNVDFFAEAYDHTTNPTPDPKQIAIIGKDYKLNETKLNSFYRLGPELDGRGAGYIYRRDVNGSAYQLFNGIGDFWEHIAGVAYYHQQNQKDLHNNFLSHFMVVDTNLHLTSLGYDPDFFKCLRSLIAPEIVVYIWFIWTPAAVFGNNDIAGDGLAMQTALNLLIKGFEEDNVNLMHVLNPVAYTPPITLASIIETLLNNRTFEHEIVPLQLLSRARTLQQAMPLGDFLATARTNLKQAIDGQFDTIFEDLVQSILATYGGRPFNVVPITHYYRSLLGYTEGLSAEREDKITSARQSLQKLLSRYL